MFRRWEVNACVLGALFDSTLPHKLSAYTKLLCAFARRRVAHRVEGCAQGCAVLQGVNFWCVCVGARRPSHTADSWPFGPPFWPVEHAETSTSLLRRAARGVRHASDNSFYSVAAARHSALEQFCCGIRREREQRRLSANFCAATLVHLGCARLVADPALVRPRD